MPRTVHEPVPVMSKAFWLLSHLAFQRNKEVSEGIWKGDRGRLWEACHKPASSWFPSPSSAGSCSPRCWRCCLAMLGLWCPSWERPLACLTSGLTATNTGILSKFPSFFSKTRHLVNSLNCQHKMCVCQKYWLDKSRWWHTSHKCFSYFALENLDLQILTLGSAELLQAISVWIFYLWIEYFEIFVVAVQMQTRKYSSNHVLYICLGWFNLLCKYLYLLFSDPSFPTLS